MIPLARMLKYGAVQAKPILDIDFSLYELGMYSTITDESGTVFGRVGSDVEVVSSEEGNVMSFTGGGYFSTPMVSGLELSSVAFEMRMIFKSTVSTENIAFSTGDYTSVPVAGFMVTLFNNLGSQFFSTDSAGAFHRSIFGYTSGTWRDLSFLWQPVSKVLIIYDNAAGAQVGSYSIPEGFGNGTQMSIGASYTRGLTNAFVGMIKSIKITRIIL